jgi:hypothetical protein
MQCNIDARGRAYRLMSGLVVVVVAIIFAVLSSLGVAGPLWGWIVTVCCLGGGIFMIFEGWAGWCAVRAMGVRTKF